VSKAERRMAEMIGLATSIAAFRHTALLMAERIITGDCRSNQIQGQLDRLRSTIDTLETALEVQRRAEVSTRSRRSRVSWPAEARSRGGVATKLGPQSSTGSAEWLRDRTNISGRRLVERHRPN
jgi:hypothetical protein